MKVLIASPRSSLSSMLHKMIPDNIQVVIPEKGTTEELVQLASDADVIVCVTLSEEVAKAAKKLQLVQKTGAGVDGIAFDALRRRATSIPM